MFWTRGRYPAPPPFMGVKQHRQAFKKIAFARYDTTAMDQKSKWKKETSTCQSKPF